jgi:hypothetical protein
MARLVHKGSLSETVDAVSEAFFYDVPTSKSDRLEAARFIASRQGAPNSYANTFGLSEKENSEGIRVFTGERMTHASARHILGEEAIGALILLDVDDKKVTNALETAKQNLGKAVESYRSGGMFCCGKCSVAYWRNLAIGGLPDPEKNLKEGMKTLKSHRKVGGGWRRFPFYYTVLALTDIDPGYAKEELRYVAPTCERLLQGPRRKDKYSVRKRDVLELAMEII